MRAWRLNNLWFGIALLLYLFLGLMKLGGTTLFIDEATRAYQASLSPAALLTELRTDIHPPLYQLILGRWARLIGWNDASLRAFSVAAGALALFLVWQTWLALGIPDSKRNAALLMLAASPAFVDYTRLAFSWPFFACMVTLLLFLLVRYERSQKPATAFGAGLAAAACLYTNYLAAPLFAALLARVAWRHRRSPRSLASLALCPVTAAALYLPWLGVFRLQLSSQMGDAEPKPFVQRTAGVATRLGSCAFQFVFGDSANPGDYVIVIVGIACALALSVVAWKALRQLFASDEQAACRAYLGDCATAFAVGIASMAFLHSDQNFIFTPERMLFALPPVMLFLAWGTGTGRRQLVAVACVLTVFASLHILYFTETSFLNWTYHSHWDRYAVELQRSRSVSRPAGTVVVFDNYSFGRVGTRYLSDVGEVVPLLEPLKTAFNPALPAALAGAEQVVWIQSARDTSSGKWMERGYAALRNQFEPVAELAFLKDAPRWTWLKEELLRRKVEENKVRAVVLRRE